MDNTKNFENTTLGRVTLLGQRYRHEKNDIVLWALDARARRVPEDPGSFDGNTPGVHSLRTLWMRSISRKVKANGNTIDFIDPTLLELFSAESEGSVQFDIQILGLHATVALSKESRVLVSPANWQPFPEPFSPPFEPIPGHPSPSPPLHEDAGELFVPPYLLMEGMLSIEKNIKLKNLLPGFELDELPGFDNDLLVELDREGIVYSAQVKPPDGSDLILTRVRLTLNNKGEPSLALLPQQQDVKASQRWLEVWRNMQTRAALTQATAWVRLTFDAGGIIPALSWEVRVVKDGKKITAVWEKTFLPDNLVTITLADQPVESQLLAPEQVLMLTPTGVTITIDNNSMKLEVGTSSKNNDIIYTYNAEIPASLGKEQLAFKTPLPMVHQPAQVRAALRKAYAVIDASDKKTLTGFMKEADGWVELPFQSELKLKLPTKIERVDALNARGSLLIGLRRQVLHQPGVIPVEVPWSVQIDEPSSYSASFVFNRKELTSINISLQGSALQARGLVWLANTKPDGHDALPVVDDNPSAFFDLVLNKTDNSAMAPFVLQQLTLIAPVKINECSWDHSDQNRFSRKPSLKSGLNLTVNINVLAAKEKAYRSRCWIRHPTLPSIQTMPLTRSDMTSPLPHVSRALTLFEQEKKQPLKFIGLMNIMPQMDKSTRDKFKAVKIDGSTATLVALSLPGLEFTPLNPSTYEVSGRYSLPLMDEVYARATLPPPTDNMPTVPATEAITALQPIALKTMWQERAQLQAATRTQQSEMFFVGAFNTPIAFTNGNLVEPRVSNIQVTVTDKVTIQNAQLSMGQVRFTQHSSTWSPVPISGDEVLQGVTDMLEFTDPREVKIGSGNGSLVGWSVAERVDDNYIIDGRGIGWAKSATSINNLILRNVNIEKQGGENNVRLLGSSAQPLQVKVADNETWYFAFTDLPMPAMIPSTWTPPAATTERRLNALENGWTWSLYSQGKNSMAPLNLQKIFRFTPAALKLVDLDAQGKVIIIKIEGALTLGQDNASHATDTLNRVTLTFNSRENGDLMLSNVEPCADVKRISWNLDPVPEGVAIASGVPQLSAELACKNGVISLKDARVDANLFASRVSVKLSDFNEDGLKISKDINAPAKDKMLVLTTFGLNLEKACLTKIGFTIELCNDKGVQLNISEVLNDSKTKFEQSGNLEWFGNKNIHWNKVEIDGGRRSIFLADPDKSQTVVIFPGIENGHFDDGVFCLALKEPETKGIAEFEVETHFAELLLSYKSSKAYKSSQDDTDLAITHLMYSNGKNADFNTLRFDGKLWRESLVTWPAIPAPSINNSANSIEIDFFTGEKVFHAATFQFSDHRIDGRDIKKASDKGINLGTTPVTWIVEATHTLNKKNGKNNLLTIHCLHALQLWGAKPLADSIDELAQKHGFTPSYRGTNTPTKDFPIPGVRTISGGFTGMLEPGLSPLLRKLNDSWILLGGMSVLCPKNESKASDEFLALHLPFIGAFCVDDNLIELKGKLNPPDKTSSLRISRHDVLGTSIKIDATTVTSVGNLSARLPDISISFVRSALPVNTFSGAALAAGWFNSTSNVTEVCWHVEQIQMHGPTKTRPNLPFPFPRAAVMLSFLFESRDILKPEERHALDNQPVLSMLVRFSGIKNQYDVKVETVQIQPRPAKLKPLSEQTENEPPTEVHTAALIDLVIGATSGLALLVVDSIEAGVEHAKQLLALAMRQVNEPAFIVQRQMPDKSGVSTFTLIQQPKMRADPLNLVTRSLRSTNTFSVDGRLTWPEQENMPKKNLLNVLLASRTPFQDHKLALAGTRGKVLPPSLAGNVFTLNNKQDSDERTVWLQEWDRIAFDSDHTNSEDAIPRAYDSPVSVMPMTPSVGAIGKALRRMDPILRSCTANMQTYLPPLIDDFDLSNRSGAMAESGVRTLVSWDDSVKRNEKQALAGPAITRSMRIPRPCTLPINTGPSSAWQRTVGWYGDAAASCLALQGTWDMLTFEPDNETEKGWYILLGKPMPIDFSPYIPNQEQMWTGAIALECKAFADNVSVENPAQFLLSLLKQAAKSRKLFLRQGSSVIANYNVELLKDDCLKFTPDLNTLKLSGKSKYTFECGWEVRALDDKPADSTDSELDTVKFRKITLPVTVPDAGEYPLPLLRYSIFFSDPNYDQVLSRAQGKKAEGKLKNEIFSFWVDRPSVTVKETIVLHVFTNKASNVEFILNALVRRKGNNTTESSPNQPATIKLQFKQKQQSTNNEYAVIIKNGYYVLPLTMLADENGKSLAAGDLLILNVDSIAAISPAHMVIPVKAVSSLAAPEAMYSLIAVKDKGKESQAWCAAHSSKPQPEVIETHITGAENQVTRRALFKWSVTEAFAESIAGFSICKTDFLTEATHIPMTIEPNQ